MIYRPRASGVRAQGGKREDGERLIYIGATHLTTPLDWHMSECRNEMASLLLRSTAQDT